MWLSEPLPFIKDFIVQLDEGLQGHHPNRRLSRIQRGWLGFCLMGIILTNSICWARFERISLGRYKIAALSWMFRHAKLPWAGMLQVGVGLGASIGWGSTKWGIGGVAQRVYQSAG